MSSTPHPRAQLSAYLDGALAPSERSLVEAHLATCADCRARLADLRATASLISALPDIAPARRLVPRVAAPPAWLAPLRTLSTLASGVSVFLFLATALLANVSVTGGAAAPALAPAVGQGGATAASVSPNAFGPIGPAAQASAAPVSGAQPSAATSLADAAKRATAPSPTPAPGAEFNVSSAAPQPGVPADRDQRAVSRGVPSLGSPWLWLTLAIVTGVLAIALQRRLRSS